MLTLHESNQAFRYSMRNIGVHSDPDCLYIEDVNGVSDSTRCAYFALVQNSKIYLMFQDGN